MKKCIAISKLSLSSAACALQADLDDNNDEGQHNYCRCRSRKQRLSAAALRKTGNVLIRIVRNNSLLSIELYIYPPLGISWFKNFFGDSKGSKDGGSAESESCHQVRSNSLSMAAAPFVPSSIAKKMPRGLRLDLQWTDVVPDASTPKSEGGFALVTRVYWNGTAFALKQPKAKITLTKRDLRDLSDSKVAAHQIEVNLSMMLSRRKGADAGGWGGRGCA